MLYSQQMAALLEGLRGFLKIRGTFLAVPTIRIKIFGVYIEYPYSEKQPHLG